MVMQNLLGKHAIVVGAGIGGLAAAKALSTYFEKVTVLERDALPAMPEARTGTPQSRQVHVLLRGGLDALVELFPDFETELERSGAVRTRVGSELMVESPGFDPFPQRDLGIHMFCMTRPLVEFAARRFVEQQGNIVLHSRCRVTRFVASPDRTAVSGVRFDLAGGESKEVAADLIVDASSRGTLTLELLDDLGMLRPKETEIGIDLNYATAIFERPATARHDWRAVIHRPSAQSGRGAFLFPIENDRWHVNLNGMHGDTPPDDVREFVAFAKTLRTPTIHDAIKDAVPVGPIHRFRLPSSIRRRFEALEHFPGGLLPIGDVICRFNPAFGQGMSVAVQEVGVLKRLLDSRTGYDHPFQELAPAFFRAIQDVLASPWSVAENDFIYEKTRGQCPKDFQQRLKFGFALQQVAARNPAVHRILAEVNNLVKPPSELRDPEIVSQVNALMAASA
jgi:2-polyprenyl-6-methoxyphenol hydroxylase-like FAD-dependent oxidoreductase